MASPSRVLVFVACIGVASAWLVEAGSDLTCYVGVYSPSGLQNGSTVACNGMCASAQTNLSAVGQTTAFFCLDPGVCAGMSLMGNCSQIPGDADVTACCCNSGSNCNIDQAGLTETITAPPVQVVTDPPIACYTGVWVHGAAVSAGPVYQACFGDCVSITMKTTAAGENHTATIYACDPSMVCRSLGILGRCSSIQDGLDGCCCDTDACIDPTKGRIPYQPLKCFAGVQVPSDSYTMGDDVACDGKCISVETTVQNKTVKVFQCASKAVCQSGLQIEGDECTSFMSGGANVTACCCDNGDNCNVKDSDNIGDKIPLANWTGTPLACWNGFYVNGQPNGTAGWSSCNGDCASIQWKTSSSGDTMTLYTCDPSQVLNDWGVNENNCGNVDSLSGLKVCSCAKSGCLDGTSNIPNTLTNLVCTVGVQTGQNFTGNTIKCGGKCASMMSTIQGVKTIAYFCADNVICDTLKLENACGPVPGDNDVEGCCCTSADNCNVALSKSTIPVPSTPTDLTDPPIACYTGIWVNGAPISTPVYQACVGDCVSISMNTTVASDSHTATIYACDPSTVCRSLGILGTCGPIQPGMTGCCCDKDTCIDPYKGRSPDKPLMCFAGVTIPSDNYTQGDDVACDGKCVSVETTVQGKRVKVFQCTTVAVCQTGLQIEGDECRSFKSGGADVQACCCDSGNNCNVKDTDNLSNKLPLANWTQAPLACWSGFYVNKQPNGTVGWTSCNGDCTSIQWKTSDNADTMTLFTCDPAQFLSDLGVNENNCAPIDNLQGLNVCSCDKSGCMDGTSNVPNNMAALTCYVGVQTPQMTNGTTVYCNGKCASMSTTIQGSLTTAFFCADTSVCENLKLRNLCGPVPGDNDVEGCCCDDANNCNLDYAKYSGTITVPASPSNSTDPPISCYTGIWVNGSPLNNAPAVYQSCQGDCVSIALNTTVAGVNHTATIYTCDPSTVCRNLGILGDCNPIGNSSGMIGCCCDKDVCIDPYKGINPSNPRSCFAGFYVPADNYTQGDVVSCDGKCISVETQVSNKTVKVYQCVQVAVCKSLLIQDNGCATFNSGPSTVKACCCDQSNNCNTIDDNLDLTKVPKANLTNTPIACWSGFYESKKPQGTVGWTNCNGDCASIQWKTNDTETMTLYTCDPVLFVQQFGAENTCGTIDNMEGLKVCGCSTNGCLDGTSNIPTLPQTCPNLGSTRDLWIFVSLFLLTVLYRQ